MLYGAIFATTHVYHISSVNDSTSSLNSSDNSSNDTDSSDNISNSQQRSFQIWYDGAGLQPYLGLRWGYQSVSSCWFMPVHFSACFVSFLFARLCVLCTGMHSLRCKCSLHIHTRFCKMLTM